MDSRAPLPDAARVLDFWFKDRGAEDWFAKNPDFDAEIRAGFGTLHALAAEGKLDRWAETPEGALALIVVLDQFSRNLHRGSAQAFACDPKALALARQAVERGFHLGFGERERVFLFMPFEHSEDPRDQELSVKYFAGFSGKLYVEAAEKHKAIIDRFGRFPHRNAALGRESTPEEVAFLAGPESSF
ncbi:MAG: DUF924 domain-containing protein [Rhodospirillales bacterium]|nr:DUF924 domain-containing protein [Rhodospirillales bacterium]